VNVGLSSTSKPGRAINGTISHYLATSGSLSLAVVPAASGWKPSMNRVDGNFILEVPTVMGNGTGPGVSLRQGRGRVWHI